MQCKQKEAIFINKLVSLHSSIESFGYTFHLKYSWKSTLLYVLTFSYCKFKKLGDIDLNKNWKMWNQKKWLRLMVDQGQHAISSVGVGYLRVIVKTCARFSFATLSHCRHSTRRFAPHMLPGLWGATFLRSVSRTIRKNTTRNQQCALVQCHDTMGQYISCVSV